MLKQVATFDAVKKLLTDERSKNYEQMTPKVSRRALHKTPNKALHFTLEILTDVSLFHIIPVFALTVNAVSVH